MNTIYDIFARKDHPEPLIYIGSVEVEAGADVKAASLARYGPETEWLEMVAVPHQHVILVFSDKEEVQ